MKEENSITKFFGDLLAIGLTALVVYVMISIGKAEKEGRPINPVKEIGKQSHKVLIDLKEGWSEGGKKDSIK